MPARKNRPDKYGAPKEAHSLLVQLTEAEDNKKFQELAKRVLIPAEKKLPGDSHYVGWPDMDTAKKMAKKGLLQEFGGTGCFNVTPLFKQHFDNPCLAIKTA